MQCLFLEKNSFAENVYYGARDGGASMSEESKVSAQHPERHSFWKGGFNVWWALGGLLSLWFTVFHGIPFMVRHATPLFGVHLVNACLVSWTCILNLQLTPFHGPRYRALHIWLGRLSLVFGALSTVFGMLTAWHAHQGAAAFAIVLSIGGTLQVLAQGLAVYFVRRGEIRHHIVCNHFVFFGGCLVPAAVRLPLLLGISLTHNWVPFSWLFPLILGGLACRATLNKRWH